MAYQFVQRNYRNVTIHDSAKAQAWSTYYE